MIYQYPQRASFTWVCWLFTLGIAPYVRAQTYSAFDLGAPPVPSYNGVFVDQINANGEVAGALYDEGQPVVVTDGNRMALGVLHLNESGDITGINSAGVTIGYSCAGYYVRCQGVQWSPDGVPSELVSGSFFYPRGINSAGDIVGHTIRSPGAFTVAKVFSDGKLTQLPQGAFQPPNGGDAFAINDSGTIVGDLCDLLELMGIRIVTQ